MSAGHRRLDIEEAGDVTIAKFVDKKILDEGNKLRLAVSN